MQYPTHEEQILAGQPANPTCPLRTGINGGCTPGCAWWVRGRCAVVWLAELAAREVRLA